MGDRWKRRLIVAEEVRLALDSAGATYAFAGGVPPLGWGEDIDVVVALRDRRRAFQSLSASFPQMSAEVPSAVGPHASWFGPGEIIDVFFSPWLSPGDVDEAEGWSIVRREWKYTRVNVVWRGVWARRLLRRLEDGTVSRRRLLSELKTSPYRELILHLADERLLALLGLKRFRPRLLALALPFARLMLRSPGVAVRSALFYLTNREGTLFWPALSSGDLFDEGD